MLKVKLLIRISTAFVLVVAGAVFAISAQETCEEGYHLFAHAMGETCIPEAPERVVVLDTGELDNALALGAPVVGAPVTDVLQYQAYVSEQLEGIADTGTISEPNFEAILELAPDLILGSKQRYEAIYEQLSQIAPTVLTESLRVPWQDNFNLHAAALGKTAEAETLIGEYDAHVAELQAALGDALDSTTISIIRFRPGQVRLYLKSSYIGYILQDVGLQRPAAQDQDVFSAEISIEQMQDADADYIFVTGYDVEDSERDTFLNSPLWQTLEAVQNGRVVDINDDTWIAGLGIQAAHLVLDDLQLLLTASSEETADACEEGFRLFDHELLATDPVCIPEDAQRIVALHNPAVELLLFTDKEIVGTFDTFVIDELSATIPQLADELSTITGIGWPANMELILELQPDLIAATENETLPYDQLSQIAPTVIVSVDVAEGDWKTGTQFWSEVFNEQDLYAEMLATYEARVAELQTLLGEDRSALEVSLVLASSYFNLIMTADAPIGYILKDVGLSRPASQALNSEESLAQYENTTFAYLSDETLNLADGDVIFLYTFPAAGAEARAASDQYLADFQANPLWQSLSAVEGGTVYPVEAHWARADTYLLANLVLDDLFTYLANAESTIPNPVNALDEAAN